MSAAQQINDNVLTIAELVHILILVEAMYLRNNFKRGIASH